MLYGNDHTTPSVLDYYMKCDDSICDTVLRKKSWFVDKKNMLIFWWFIKLMFVTKFDVVLCSYKQAFQMFVWFSVVKYWEKYHKFDPHACNTCNFALLCLALFKLQL